MADWLRLFVLSPHIRVLAINEAPAGGPVGVVRLEARVFGHTVEGQYNLPTQAEADYEFAKLDAAGVAGWLAHEGAKREADHARCM